MKPLVIDLYCGLGGWVEGFLQEGYDVVGFDIERHDYGKGGYPAQLVLQDVLTLHGSQFRDAACIVASPPCQCYSYMAMPWKLAKAKAAAILESPARIAELNALFNACFRIQLEASQAAGHEIPMVVENVKGAQPWVGRAAWHYGSYYLWGDVPALMPRAGELKGFGGTWFGVQSDGNKYDQREVNPVSGTKVPGNDTFKRTGAPCGKLTDSRYPSKVPGINWSGHGKPGYKPQGFNVMAAQRYRQEQGGNKGFAGRFEDTPMARFGSRSDSRKAASAQIAKIPFPLANWIARCFLPVDG